jgi:hypothetical protein
MNLEEFHAKYGKEHNGMSDIARYLYRIDLEADHMEPELEPEIEFLRDLYQLFLHLFPDCDPYRRY